MKRHKWSIVFIFIVLIVSIYYDYHHIVFKRPQSVHSWRQSDCASIALNYYQNGMNFFQPETHNLTSDGGTSGNACTSEIPILYYSVAGLYKIFGYHESLFRILNTLLFFIGLFYLFKLFNILLQDVFWSISLSLLFFTAPVLVFYGNNFLSNSSALSFSFVGWYYFVRFYRDKNEKCFAVSLLFFLIAASFKVTALFSLFAIGGLYLSELFGFIHYSKKEKLFKYPVKQFAMFAAVIFIVGAWILYARYYNQKHDCYYFSTTIFPIWDLDREAILAVLKNIQKIWLSQYFHPSVLILFAVGLLFVITFYKKNLKLLNVVLIILLIEVVAYISLQFWTFEDHDYYTIDMYILPVILIAGVFYSLKQAFPQLYRSSITKSIFLCFLLFNVYYAHSKIQQRYSGWMNNNGKLNDFYTVTPFLRENSITANDTVIAIPDYSHVSLYLMNQKGWTEYADARFNRAESIKYNRDSLGIQNSIDKGAEYLIVDGINQLYEKPYLQSFCYNLKGRYNDILVFDLNSGHSNFSLQTKEPIQYYFCGAEILAENKQEFIGSDSIVFRNGDTQTSNYSFSGSYSCRLDSDHQYGMTVLISNLREGESLQISVWRRKSKNGHVIASAGDYYNNNFEVLEVSGEWEKLLKDVFVPKELEGKELGIYLYNPEEEPVYFDDLEIIRFKSIFPEDI